MSILSKTHPKGEFRIGEFRKMVKEYIDDRKDGMNILYNDAGHPVGKEKKIMSVCDFCCEYNIDSEDDFWILMQHNDREYARHGKILINHIKNFAQKLIVNDKNVNYARLVGETYFPDEKLEDVMKKPTKKEELQTSKDIDLKDILKGSDKELLKALKESLSKPNLSSQE